jgi:RimJ/RimL family protein N-acetyltransferase
LSFGSKGIEDSVRHLELCRTEQNLNPRIRYYLVAELRENGACIGDAGFEWRDEGRSEGEMGYFLLPAYWGKGIATECARLVLRLAFDHCGAQLMCASCNEQNAASEGVMRKCGMHRDIPAEKTGRRVYRIARSEWCGN